MPRLCCGCFSRKKRKSFPIHEKQQDAEINKVFIRHVENIRVTPPLTIKCETKKKTISKGTFIEKDSNENDKQTRIPITKLFENSKQVKTPSPIEDHHEKTVTNTVSSWPSSTESDLARQKKSLEYRLQIEQKKIISQTKKISNDIKATGKSKLVLENVRKMIKDQNIHQQHLNHTQQKESARL